MAEVNINVKMVGADEVKEELKEIISLMERIKQLKESIGW